MPSYVLTVVSSCGNDFVFRNFKFLMGAVQHLRHPVKRLGSPHSREGQRSADSSVVVSVDLTDKIML